MDIPQIQSQLAINKNNINRLHNYISLIKQELKCDFLNSDYVYNCVTAIRIYSKKIAQLVVLQKALKKDISRLIYAGRLYKMAAQGDTLLAEICEEVISDQKGGL